MADQHGGKRNGAGRKFKADKHEGAITEAEKQIAGKLPDLIKNLFKLAYGVTVKETVFGNPTVYTKPPDLKANQYLVDRIMGKPTERTEVTGQDGTELFPPGLAIGGLTSDELRHLRDIARKLADGGPEGGGGPA